MDKDQDKGERRLLVSGVQLPHKAIKVAQITQVSGKGWDADNMFVLEMSALDLRRLCTYIALSDVTGDVRVELSPSKATAMAVMETANEALAARPEKV